MNKNLSLPGKTTAAALAAILVFTGCSNDSAETNTKLDSTASEDTKQKENEKGNASTSLLTIKDGNAILAKSEGSNPMVGNSDTGDYIYGGDPSVLVDGDIVYLYTGHDCSTDTEVARAIYNIPEYLCYSSTDLIHWKSEGIVMDMKDIPWTKDTTTAWAAQTAKYKDKYYLYYCSWDKTSAGKQSIGVAVSDSPTGPFQDIGEPLVKGNFTQPESNNWNDIDPTVWVDTDEDGTEHRYLAWGNSDLFFCELNEDMISVKDQNEDGKITCGEAGSGADIIFNENGIDSFTEAPWLYRRKDENGKSYGSYYLFYAYGWRERMGYAMCDEPDIINGEWKNSAILMFPTATSNTNHMAVFDFKGKTYFVYHNGSLPAGNGYRRSACITELTFNEDGTVAPINETAAGLSGTKCNIRLADDTVLAHEMFLNSGSDQDYPIMDIPVSAGNNADDPDSHWVIVKGKSAPDDETYVSIQSENKPGLYLTANDKQTVVLAQDTTASEDTANAQTFHTVVGLEGKETVSFESAAYPGSYLTMQDGKLVLTDGTDTANASFSVTQVQD